VWQQGQRAFVDRLSPGNLINMKALHVQTLQHAGNMREAQTEANKSVLFAFFYAISSLNSLHDTRINYACWLPQLRTY
jgi:hypothetical protein